LYAVPNIRVETHSPEHPVPVLWYRGTAGTHAVFAVEAFMDELATAAGRDPVEFRRALLADQPRMLNVLELVADKSNWDSPTSPGRGRGVAMCEQRGSFMAQVAEVSVRNNNAYSVDRVITAIDCGLTINPDNVRAQMEGGTGFGLSSTIGDEITLKNGFVQQSNFDKYRLLRIDQMPDIEVHIVGSAEPPTGIGDVSPMLIAAAVANALHAVTGQRYRRLPIKLTA
jgi:isoquinoline 1-oxidoreductase beta subunit